MRIFLWGVAFLGAAVAIATVWAALKVGSDSDRLLDDAPPSAPDRDTERKRMSRGQDR